MTDTRLLVIDDDPEITSALARGLALHGFAVTTENRADLALNRLTAERFDAAIVDVMLGADSGLTLVKTARAQGARLPIVMLSALSDIDQRAAGLEAGADDYVVKPFSFDELVARIEVQRKRTRSDRPRPARLTARDNTISTATRSQPLSDREFALLALLAAHAPEPISRGAIFDALWAGDSSTENVVDVYIGYLRRKLDPCTDFGFEIKTIRNRGFCLDGLAPSPDEGLTPTKV